MLRENVCKGELRVVLGYSVYHDSKVNYSFLRVQVSSVLEKGPSVSTLHYLVLRFGSSHCF